MSVRPIPSQTILVHFVPCFFVLTLPELTIGRVLGRGGFCVVSEVTKITLKKEDAPQANDHNKSDDEHYIHNVVQDRGFMSKHCIRKGKDYRYAIKRMQEASRKDPQTFVNSVVDLAVGKKTCFILPCLLLLYCFDVLIASCQLVVSISIHASET